MKLLMVDDEELQMQAIMTAVDFAACGVDETFYAGTVQQARNIYRRERPELLLLDIEMPEEGGLEFLSWIRKEMEDESAVCIFLTCHPEFNYALEALQLRAMDYLLKPVEFDKLSRAVEEMVRVYRKNRSENELIKYGQQWVSSHAQNHGAENEPIGGQELIDSLKTYILEHLGDKLVLSELGDLVHLNPDYLNRMFKNYTGLPINKYIIRERMYLAKRLIEEEHISATAAAFEVGYQSYSNFSAMFYRFFGINPGEINERKTI